MTYKVKNEVTKEVTYHEEAIIAELNAERQAAILNAYFKPAKVVKTSYGFKITSKRRKEMINVRYMYYRESDGSWNVATKEFWEVRSAVKFIWSLKERKARLLGYSCDDMEDLEYLENTIKMSEVNANV